MDSTDEIEISITDLLQMIGRHLMAIILCTVIGTVGAFCITRFCITPKYASSTTLYVNNGKSRQDAIITSTDLNTSQELVSTYSVIMQSASVINEVAERSKLGYTPEEIADMFTAESVNNTKVMKITVVNTNPAHAQIIANTFVEVAPKQIQRVVHAGAVEVIDYANLPTKPSSPSIPKNTAIGFFLGLILSIAFAAVYEMTNTTIHSAEDLTKILKIPVLGQIPDMNDKLSGKVEEPYV